MDTTKSVIDKVKAYKQLVESSGLPLCYERVWLFGSYAKGVPQEHSDIDVAFVVSHRADDYRRQMLPLWKLTMKVDSRIEPHVVARDTDYSDFIAEIERTGIAID